MALSEQERKLLEQLEASLKAEDPKLADTLSGSSSLRLHRRRATLAGLGFVVGLAALLGGIQFHPVVTIAGFLMMLMCALLGTKSWQRVGTDAGGPQRRRSASPRENTQDFMSRLEERWRRQQDEQ